MKILAPVKRREIRTSRARYVAIFEAVDNLADDEALPIEVDHKEVDVMRTAVLHYFKKRDKPVTSRYDKDECVIYFQFVAPGPKGNGR